MIKLPYEPKAVLHRHGGRITRIAALKHQKNKASGKQSLDAWWYVGDIEWFDGTKSTDHPIDPPMLCVEEKNDGAEVRELSELMMAYLAENGEWNGKFDGWRAKR